MPEGKHGVHIVKCPSPRLFTDSRLDRVMHATAEEKLRKANTNTNGSLKIQDNGAGLADRPPSRRCSSVDDYLCVANKYGCVLLGPTD